MIDKKNDIGLNTSRISVLLVFFCLSGSQFGSNDALGRFKNMLTSRVLG